MQSTTTTIAVDLAKSVFQIAVSQHPGKVSESHRLTRGQFLPFFAERQPALVVLEACGTAHFWAREIQALGHQVELLPPHAVRCYVHRNKTDQADAEALLEAHRNDRLRSVPVKSVLQQAVAGLHRMRSAWMADRNGRINQVRGLLRELGFAIPVGARHVIGSVMGLLQEGQLPEPLRPVLREAIGEIGEFDRRIKEVEKQLRAVAVQMPVVKRLQSIPGVGLLTSTALVAFVGDVQRFPSGRHFASYLGLTPREHSSGLRRHLGSITKAGDVYLRVLLIGGARSVLIAAKRVKSEPPDRLRGWALQVHRLRGQNRAAVAVANKLSRIVWAVWRNGTTFETRAIAG